MIGTYMIDAEGNVTPCSEQEASSLQADLERTHVAHGVLINGTEVSTVFTPYALVLPGEEPQTFETAVISVNAKSTVVARYRTKREALAGHADVVRDLACSLEKRFGLD